MGKDLIVSRGLVKHNGAFYEAGDIIEGLSLDDKKRAELLEYGQAYEPVLEEDGSSEGGSGTGGSGEGGSGEGGSGEGGSGENGSGEGGTDEGGSGEEGSDGSVPPLAAAKVQKMPKDDLLQLAAASNVDISSCTNNEQRAAEIIAALGLK